MDGNVGLSIEEMERRCVRSGCFGCHDDETASEAMDLPPASEKVSDRCLGLEGTELRRDKLEDVSGRTANAPDIRSESVLSLVFRSLAHLP